MTLTLFTRGLQTESSNIYRNILRVQDKNYLGFHISHISYKKNPIYAVPLNVQFNKIFFFT